MDWTAKIDAYCERVGDGFWAEPYNAWTNAAFWLAAGIAAACILRYRARVPAGGRPMPTLGLWVLVGWLVAIGLGSFFFHTFATRWAALSDVGSIVGWIGTYVWLQMRRVLGWGPGVSGLALTAFFAAAPLSLLVCPLGVCAYLPTLAAAVGLGLWASRQRLAGGGLLLAAGAVFAASMVTAALDGPLCDAIPIGTHWLWHLLNATALTLGMLALTRELHALASAPSDGA